MKNYYIIHQDGTYESGSFSSPEEGWIEYTIGSEPQELVDLFLADKLAQENEALTHNALSVLTVTTTSGKEFYADDVSRGHISDAISIGIDFSQVTTMWKLTKNMIPQIQEVTIDELKEARMLALQASATLKGIA